MNDNQDPTDNSSLEKHQNDRHINSSSSARPVVSSRIENLGNTSTESSSPPPPQSSSHEVDNSENVIVENRHCTDIFFLILIIAFVIVLIGLIAYCMTNGDIYRIINGYDDCGNVCGRMNAKIEGLGCSGANRINEPFLLVDPSSTSGNPTSVYKTCVKSCANRPSYKEFLNRCLPIKTSSSSSSTSTSSKKKISLFSKTGVREFFQEVSEDLETCWSEVLILCFVAFVFSIIIVFALRFMAFIIIWLVLIGVIIALVAGTIFLWVEYKFSFDPSSDSTEGIHQDEKRSTYLALAIVITIATICICLIIFAMRKRITLVVELFKESGKALSYMPFLLFEPILTFASLIFFASLWFYFAVYIESSGTFILENNQSGKYAKNSTIMVTRWYNLLALFWFVNFVIGCQHMVVAGAVVRWFFTRNKSKLSSPILKSFHTLIRFHLGTVSKGSFLIALVNLIRVVLGALLNAFREPTNKLFVHIHTFCQCCCYIFDNFLQYLSRNAYIETAINGEGFCESGKRAFTILTNNALRVIAINSIGDFVLLLAKVFVVLATVLIGIELIQKKDGLYHSWVPLAIAGLFAYLVAHCFISVYEMTIDTIFICFCEDCEQNDGISKPYYMSRGLMEFVQNSKKALQLNNPRPSKVWSAENT